MGEIAVFQPQDILKNQSNSRHCNNSKKPIKTLVVSDPNPSTVPAKVSHRKTRYANSKNSSNSPSKNDNKNMILGKVKILKRGEALTDGTKSLVLRKRRTQKSWQPPPRILWFLWSAGSIAQDVIKTNGDLWFLRWVGLFYIAFPELSLLLSFCKKKNLDINNNDVTCDLGRILRVDID